MEYAQALVPALPSLEQAGIRPLAIAIGDQAGADRFCIHGVSIRPAADRAR